MLRSARLNSSTFLCINRDKAPGQRECDHSIDGINKCIRDIEHASLAAVGQSLPCRDDISLEVPGISLYCCCNCSLYSSRKASLDLKCIDFCLIKTSNYFILYTGIEMRIKFKFYL